MKKHVLSGETGGDTTWFERLNSFEQQETKRQARFKKHYWPNLEDGVWSKRPADQYPHILPVGELDKAFYPPLADNILRYLKYDDIALHSEVLNLRSSQAACLNILFPLKEDTRKAVQVLSPLLPAVRRVSDIEFEFTGSSAHLPYTRQEEVTDWLGEPPGGKRGQNRTSIDAVVHWEDMEGRRRLTFIEFKYSEKEFGSCGGYKSKGNKHPEMCSTLDAQTRRPQANCYLENGKSNRTSRHYWKHLAEAGISSALFGGVKGCPFMGPFYQLMRQYLLAAWCKANTVELEEIQHGEAYPGVRQDEVDVVVLGFRGNTSLLNVPTHLRHLGNDIIEAWNRILVGVSPLRMVHVEDLAPQIAKVDGDWAKYLSDRYGLQA